MNLALPGDLGREKQHEQAQLAQLRAIRLQIATSNLPDLLAIEYGMALNEVDEESELYGKEAAEEKQIKVCVGRAADIAIAGADALMVRLGMIQAQPAASEEGTHAAN